MRPLRAAWVVAALLAVAPAAHADDPGRWLRSRADPVPLEYFQGLTHDPGGRVYFAGLFEGLYRTDAALREQARNALAIPPDVKAATGFNHIGDPTWDAGEGGRLLLPLECFDPLRGNTCGRGAIGVADPATLAWRYLVPLDPADIAKAMWAEVSPDGQLLWTSSGPDLLAYRTAEIAAGATAPIRPVRRLPRAVPPSGITGAAFHRGRMLLAGQNAGPLQVWSVDVDGAAARPPRLELELEGVHGESEGLDVLAARGGLLHWLISPFARDGLPTFGLGHSELLSFVPRADGRLRLALMPRQVPAGRRTRVSARVWLTLAGRRHPIAGARVGPAGARGARTDDRGIARLALRPRGPGRLRVTAAKDELLPARAAVRVLPGR